MKFKSIYIAFLAAIILTCCQDVEESKDQLEVSLIEQDLVKVTEELQLARDSIKQKKVELNEISVIVDSLQLVVSARKFYEDYVEINAGPHITKGQETSITYSDFVENLESSGLFTENFVKTEISRITKCQSNPEECEWVDKNYWFLLDQNSDGVDIEILNIRKDSAKLVLRPYYYWSTADSRAFLANLLLSFIKDDQKWTINEFQFDGHIQ